MKNNILKTLSFFLFILIAEAVFARAGGGGGGSSGGGSGILTYILLPFFIIYSALVSVLLQRKRNKVKTLLTQLEKEDPIWNHRSMKIRIEEIFFKVQKAWMERNQDLAKDCMSERIYSKHKNQTDAMIIEGRKNMLSKINLKEVMIFSLADYVNDSKDQFSAHIKASMIDYDIDDISKQVLSGDPTSPEKFKEIWHFIRQGNNWVLDEIDQNASYSSIRGSKIFKE